MIVCQCNVLKSCQVKAAITRAKGRDGLTVVTPGVVFRQLGCRPACGICMQHFNRLIAEQLEDRRMAEPERSD